MTSFEEWLHNAPPEAEMNRRAIELLLDWFLDGQHLYIAGSPLIISQFTT